MKSPPRRWRACRMRPFPRSRRGTNGTAPTEGDTSITDPTIVEVQTVEYPAPDTVRFNFTFGYMDGAGNHLRIWAAGGRWALVRTQG